MPLWLQTEALSLAQVNKPRGKEYQLQWRESPDFVRMAGVPPSRMTAGYELLCLGQGSCACQQYSACVAALLLHTETEHVPDNLFMLAAKTNAIIVPFAVVGADDAYDIFMDAEQVLGLQPLCAAQLLMGGCTMALVSAPVMPPSSLSCRVSARAATSCKASALMHMPDILRRMRAGAVHARTGASGQSGNQHHLPRHVSAGGCAAHCTSSLPGPPIPHPNSQSGAPVHQVPCTLLTPGQHLLYMSLLHCAAPECIWASTC